MRMARNVPPRVASTERRRRDVTKYILELIPVDAGATPQLTLLPGDDLSTCTTISELRAQFGGHASAVIDPAGDEHLVILEGLASSYSPSTQLLIRWQRVDGNAGDVPHRLTAT
jgi:hypothetical protein